MSQGYTHGWRHYKLWLLVEKLALVSIPFFFPERWDDFIGYTVACVLLVGGLLFTSFTRPHVDALEFAMDITSR